jgi:threonine dehydrogenase-like Zn-dependent dehydrogenase
MLLVELLQTLLPMLLLRVLTDKIVCLQFDSQLLALASPAELIVARAAVGAAAAAVVVVGAAAVVVAGAAAVGAAAFAAAAAAGAAVAVAAIDLLSIAIAEPELELESSAGTAGEADQGTVAASAKSVAAENKAAAALASLLPPVADSLFFADARA